MLDRLAPRPGAVRPTKRVGRGPGSGNGKTSGRGVKGQGKRSPGREVPFHFEGGQMPLARRLPKRGFNSPTREDVAEVRLGDLERLDEAAEVDLAALQAAGIVSRKALAAKIILSGKLSKKLTVKGDVKASKGARAAIESAGGRVEVAEPAPAAKKLQKKAEGAPKA